MLNSDWRVVGVSEIERQLGERIAERFKLPEKSYSRLELVLAALDKIPIERAPEANT